jgi:hypothetical protein
MKSYPLLVVLFVLFNLATGMLACFPIIPLASDPSLTNQPDPYEYDDTSFRGSFLIEGETQTHTFHHGTDIDTFSIDVLDHLRLYIIEIEVDAEDLEVYVTETDYLDQTKYMWIVPTANQVYFICFEPMTVTFYTHSKNKQKGAYQISYHTESNPYTDDDLEPNETFEAAKPWMKGSPLAGTLSNTTDIDFITVPNLVSEKIYTFSISDLLAELPANSFQLRYYLDADTYIESQNGKLNVVVDPVDSNPVIQISGDGLLSQYILEWSTSNLPVDTDTYEPDNGPLGSLVTLDEQIQFRTLHTNKDQDYMLVDVSMAGSHTFQNYVESFPTGCQLQNEVFFPDGGTILEKHRTNSSFYVDFPVSGIFILRVTEINHGLCSYQVSFQEVTP